MATLVLLVICALAYGAGVGGMALALGGPLGWGVLAVGGVIPGGYLLVRAAEDRAIERDRAAQRGEVYRPPPGSAEAPEPIPPMPMSQHD